MPNYDYVCGCGRVTEVTCAIKERKREVKCSWCGGRAKRVYSFRKAVFKPIVMEHICETPIRVTSKSQLRELQKVHNVRIPRVM